MADWSQTWTFFDGEWREGNVPLWGVRTHAIWLGSSVFDGARAFEGVVPDVDLHCTRVNASARTMFLKPVVPVEQWLDLVRDGMKRFAPGTPLYIRPMYWAERAGPQALPPDPESTRWCLVVYDTPMRKPDGFSITLSPFRRPTLETAPVDAKSVPIPTTHARCSRQNHMASTIASSATCWATSPSLPTDVFMARMAWSTRDAERRLPQRHLRQRLVKLLRADGVSVVETVLR
jgi:branched-chain amino acid aminotransferase